MDEDEIIVEVDPEISENVEVIEKAKEPVKEPEKSIEKKPPVEDLAEQFKELKSQAERDRQAREDSERRAREARQEAERSRREAAAARTEATDSQYYTVKSGIEAAKSEATAAEQEYKTAFEAGDPAAMAAAQRKIARAEARIIRLDEAQADIEARRSEPERFVQQQQPSDPIEAFIESRTEPSKRWLREHRDWLTDRKKSLKLDAAHSLAQADGIQVDSPEYFEFVEKSIGLREEPKEKSRTRRPSVPVAPVQANGGDYNGGAPIVRLTQTEATAARDGTHVWGKQDLAAGRIKDANLLGKPIGTQEFARRKHIMQKQGWYDQTYTEQ